MEFFQSLGRLITQRWKARNYNEKIFPEIANDALTELPPYRHVNSWEIVEWATKQTTLPPQADMEAKFGDPPLTVYSGRAFRIEALFWIRGLPAVHQHSFSGAFHVLEGSSIHSLWTFEPQHRVAVRLILGRTEFQSAEILLQGDTRPILAGDQMYHATYHLDKPSITIVVRTGSEADRQPQYTLLPPTVAYPQQDTINTVKRQNQILNMLLASGQSRKYQELALHFCATQDAYSLFQMLISTFVSIEDESDREQLLLIARLKHPELMTALEPVLRRQEISSRIGRIRQSVIARDLKFFLALLRNIPDRDIILELVQQRYPHRDPITAVVDWVDQLSELDVLEVHFHESWLLMLRCLLTTSSASEAERAYMQHTPVPNGPSNESELRELSSALQNYWLLNPLMAGAARPGRQDTVRPITANAGGLAQAAH